MASNLQYFFASVTNEDCIRQVLLGLDGEGFHILISNLSLLGDEVVWDRWMDIYNTLVYQTRV